MSQMDRKVRGKVAKKLKEILQPSINEEGMKIRSTGETKSLISSVLIENCPPSKLFSLQQLCRELSEGLMRQERDRDERDAAHPQAAGAI